tara:strand:+ start:153 stop:764 length:612 start_codon:yes stop_codon:yes gene_type:complete
MVKNQILPNNVKNKALIESFSTIQKEIFVPEDQYDLVYTDSEIKISKNRNLMKTFVIAKMLDRCNFNIDDKVLIIGCLTGYSIAILSKMVNYVVGIDNEKEIIDMASKNINKLNILNCSIFYKKDLSQGLSRNAPYDKIFIEGSVKSVPAPIIKQLKDDGEIFVTLKNQNYVGDFVRGLKIESNLSIEKCFNTNVKDKMELII